MQEEIITVETAKLAKEKGFNLECLYIYDEKGELDSAYSYLGDLYFSIGDLYFSIGDIQQAEENEHLCYLAPTQSLLQKWLREVHKIEILIKYRLDVEDYFSIVYLKNGGVKYTSKCYFSYEEALEIALLEALKLIKI